MMVALGPRMLSVELESAGRGVELAEIVGTLAENAKRREAILSAFYVTRVVDGLDVQVISSPSETLFVTTRARPAENFRLAAKLPPRMPHPSSVPLSW